MTHFNSTLGVIIFHLLTAMFLAALWLMYDPFAVILAYGAIMAHRYSIHCHVQKFGISLR